MATYNNGRHCDMKLGYEGGEREELGCREEEEEEEKKKGKKNENEKARKKRVVVGVIGYES